MILSKLSKIFKKHKFECYFDASYSKKKSNGAFYIVNNGNLIKKSIRAISCKSSDMAEAEMLHCLLQYVSQKIPQGSTVCIYGDAKTVIDGATGRCPKSKRHNKLYLKYMALAENYRLSIEHIPREQNTLADQLSKNIVKDFDKRFYGETANAKPQKKSVIKRLLSIFHSFDKPGSKQKESETSALYQKQLKQLVESLQEQLAEKNRLIEALQEQLAEKDGHIDKVISTLFFTQLSNMQGTHLLDELRKYKH